MVSLKAVLWIFFKLTDTSGSIFQGPEDHINTSILHYILALRPKTRGIRQTMVCRNLMFMRAFGPLILAHGQYFKRPAPQSLRRPPAEVETTSTAGAQAQTMATPETWVILQIEAADLSHRTRDQGTHTDELEIRSQGSASSRSGRSCIMHSCCIRWPCTYLEGGKIRMS